MYSTHQPRYLMERCPRMEGVLGRAIVRAWFEALAAHVPHAGRKSSLSRSVDSESSPSTLAYAGRAAALQRMHLYRRSVPLSGDEARDEMMVGDLAGAMGSPRGEHREGVDEEGGHVLERVEDEAVEQRKV